MRQSEILLADPPVIEKALDAPGHIKWAHSTWAAVNTFVSKWKDKPPNVMLTRNGSAFGQQMGEYVIGHILIREREFLKIVEAQQQKVWLPSRWAENHRPLTSLTIGVLGVGEIGGEVCRMCHSLGMEVWGMTRSPVSPASRSPYIHQYRLQTELPELLSECDYVCSVLPTTPETTGLLNGDILQHCQKKKSVLINIGRGSVVSESEVLKALRNGWLGGAVLDVFTEEPLPADSPLWSHPGVRVTPHCSGTTTATNVVKGFLINYDLYTRGQELRWKCDFDRGY